MVAVSAAASSSCTPVTATVWRVFQSTGVKISACGGTVAAAVSSETTVTVTVANGRVASRTPKLAVPPSASVRLDAPTRRLAVSSSSTVTVTSADWPL